MTGGHRIETSTVPHHVRVDIDGRTVAESRYPVLLRETGLPDRYYLPPGDVRFDLLEPSALHTTCPVKGVASYWTLRAGTGERPVAWAYPDPVPGAAAIAGHLAFSPEFADVTVVAKDA
ncbi:Uncharacterized conserved protein, DUF427 family [Streptomyces sp. Termitarium-T10T-6]|nr:DUF427 domain-containing protein [Streptomyces sp. Termitarium-T10T-6]SCD72483.1 Uncharacterized conserved protein, DUF427 family [Streptomyces sp. Termitarium-T10T-6]